MKSRASIQVIVSLVFALGAASLLYWWVANMGARWPGGNTGPSGAQLESIPTFGRRCSRREECEPPLSCVRDARVRGRRCLGNECNTDADCEPDTVCRAVPAEGPPARLCVVQGEQPEGARCAEFPLKKNEACQGTLLCNRTFCGRRCRVDIPSSCPAGSTCLESAALEPSCVPDCQQLGCPDDKRCFHLEEHFAVCGVHGNDTDCEARPCPPGEKCRKTLASWSDKVYLDCYRPCAADSPCPPGYFCGYGSCVEECDPDLDLSCGPNRKCAHHTELNKWFCLG